MNVIAGQGTCEAFPPTTYAAFRAKSGDKGAPDPLHRIFFVAVQHSLPCFPRSKMSMSIMERPRIRLRLCNARSNLGLGIYSGFSLLLDKMRGSCCRNRSKIVMFIKSLIFLAGYARASTRYHLYIQHELAAPIIAQRTGRSEQRSTVP